MSKEEVFSERSCATFLHREVLESWGVWEQVAALEVTCCFEETPEGLVAHEPDSCYDALHESLKVSAPVTLTVAALSQDTVLWCACFVSSRAGWPDLPEDARWILWELGVFTVALRGLVVRLETDATVELRNLVHVMTDPQEYTSPLDFLQVGSQSKALWQDQGVHPLQLQHKIMQEEIYPARKVLVSCRVQESSRMDALAALVAGTELCFVERDETDLLVGTTAPEDQYVRGTNSQQLWSATLQYGNLFGVSFHRMPRYAFEFLLHQNLQESLLEVQCVPWDDALVFSELAVLWTPEDTSSPLCGLSRAVSVLKRV